MELKFYEVLDNIAHYDSSNRTFMELKFYNKVPGRSIQYRSNRTFMELKYITNILVQPMFLVLIVPLWN